MRQFCALSFGGMGCPLLFINFTCRFSTSMSIKMNDHLLCGAMERHSVCSSGG